MSLETKKKAVLYYKNMFTSFKRVIKFSWQSFCRNSGLSAMVVFILVITISLMTSLFLFQGMSRFIISYLQEKIDISVSFNINTQETKILEIKDELLKMPEVENIEYLSEQQALENFIQKHQDDENLMIGLEEVMIDIPFPFPAVLNIKALEPGHYEQIVRFLEGENFKPLIYKIDYYDRKLIIERVFTITEWINRVGLIFSLILGLIAFLVTFNTIKLSIGQQKEELAVQRLVGASNWFIRGPFLVQGMIAGFIAGLISLLIFASIVHFFGHNVGILLPGFDISAYFFNQIFIIFLGQAVVGMGLGIISAAIAINRYLKI